MQEFPILIVILLVYHPMKIIHLATVMDLVRIVDLIKVRVILKGLVVLHLLAVQVLLLMEIIHITGRRVVDIAQAVVKVQDIMKAVPILIVQVVEDQVALENLIL